MDIGDLLLIIAAVLWVAWISRVARVSIHARYVRGQIVIGSGNVAEQSVGSNAESESTARRFAFWINSALGVVAALVTIASFVLKLGA